MPIVQRAPAWRRVRPWLSAVAAVALVLGALAGPALAQERPNRLTDGLSVTRLGDPRVSRRIARPSTTIRFSVTYRNGAGSAPAYVRVLVDGRPRAMAAVGGDGHYRRGVQFACAAKLPVGRHRIRFEAMSSDGTPASIRAGTIRVVARRSGSSADPGSRDAAGPHAPAASSAPAGAGPVARGEPSRIDPDGPPGAAADLGSGSSDPAGAAGSTGSTSAGRDDSVPHLAIGAVDAADDLGAPTTVDPSGASAVPSDADSVASGGSAGGSGSIGGRGSGGSGSGAIDLSGGGHGLFDGVLRAYPVMVTTSGTVVVWAAFVFFGKRRRDGEPTAPDPVLAAYAAAGPEPLPVAALVPPAASQQRIPPGADPTEAGMPRWRRPSLIQARKTDPLRTATTFASLTFADGAVEPFDGMECRRIRYRLVRLMDVPDEVRANEIGIVDEGDEVQVIEAQGSYRLVLCPDGQQGWLHKMVLGELVDDSVAAGPDGIDEDVLTAFLSHRAQSA